MRSLPTYEVLQFATSPQSASPVAKWQMAIRNLWPFYLARFGSCRCLAGLNGNSEDLPAFFYPLIDKVKVHA